MIKAGTIPTIIIIIIKLSKKKNRRKKKRVKLLLIYGDQSSHPHHLLTTIPTTALIIIIILISRNTGKGKDDNKSFLIHIVHTCIADVSHYRHCLWKCTLFKLVYLFSRENEKFWPILAILS